MPVYFGKPLSGFAKAPPEFAARKIELLKTDVVSAGYRGLPFIYSALYAAYIYFLPYFIQATVTKKKVQVSRYFAGNYYGLKIDKLMAWAYPDLVVGATPGHDAEFNNLAKMVEGVIISGKQTKTMSIPNVTPQVFSEVRGSNVTWDAPCDQGRSNLNDFLGFLHILRIFTGFLMTHQYPHNHDQPAPNPHKRTKLETYMAEDTTVGEDAEMDDKEDPVNDPDVHFKLIRYAKPSPSDFPFSGGPNDVPFLPGILFPYFHGSILPSYTAVISVIKTYFFSCLGDTEEDCAATLRVIKKASTGWGASDSGLSLQHLASGIQLAIETESRLFVIMEGLNYLGFVLLGYGFKVVTAAGVQGSLSAENLRSEIQNMESRASVIGHLRRKLEVMVDQSGLDVDIKDQIPEVADLSKSIRGARKFILNNPELLEDKDALGEVEALMRRAYQTEPSWKVNKTNVQRAVTMIIDNHDIPDDVPFFVSQQVFSDTSKVHEIMAAFGPTAFSFNQAGGTDYPIPREGEEDVASELVDVPAGKGRTRKEKTMSSIYLALKPMRSCVYDFNQVMLKRIITQKKERAGAQKCIQLTGSDRDEVWDNLVDLLRDLDKTTLARRQRAQEEAPAPTFHVGIKRKLRDDF